MNATRTATLHLSPAERDTLLLEVDAAGRNDALPLLQRLADVNAENARALVLDAVNATL